MTSPAVSRWVYNYSDASADFCAQSCAKFCANYIQRYANLRSALFGSLSD